MVVEGCVHVWVLCNDDNTLIPIHYSTNYNLILYTLDYVEIDAVLLQGVVLRGDKPTLRRHALAPRWGHLAPLRGDGFLPLDATRCFGRSLDSALHGTRSIWHPSSSPPPRAILIFLALHKRFVL